MSQITVSGNKPLQGEVEISGSINSALKLIISSLYTTEDIFLTNIPNVDSIQAELNIIKELGGSYEWMSKNFLKINNSKLKSSKIPLSLGKNLITSYLFAGPLLYRFGEAEIPIPDEGVDSILKFINSWSMLNIEVNFDKEFIYLRSDNAKAGRIELERPSQMATTNAILSSIYLSGTTTIINSSEDVELEDLIRFLNEMGASVSKESKKVISVTGKDHFKAANYSCSSEVSEAVYFGVLSLVTTGNILIKNIEKKNMSIFVSILNRIGGNYEFVSEDSLRVWRKSEKLESFDLDLTSYPSFTSNYLPYLIFLALKCEGTSKFIVESFKNKFEFVYILNRFNAKIKIYDTGKDYEPCEIYVNGVTDLKMDKVELDKTSNSPIVLLSALTTSGDISIYNSEKMESVFENLSTKVVELGGDLKHD